MLFSTRALTYLIEALPSSAAMIVEKGAIGHFCEKLLSIEYMDVAEQTLQVCFLHSFKKNYFSFIFYSFFNLNYFVMGEGLFVLF